MECCPGIGITWRVGVGRVAPATIVVLYARDVGFPETTLAILGGFKAVIIVIIADHTLTVEFFIDVSTMKDMNKITIDINPKTEEVAQAPAKSLGMTLSDIINIKLQQLVYHHQSILEAPYPVLEIDQETENILDEVHAEIEAGHVSRDYDNIDDMIKDLESKQI